jgi:prolipoprotein diacylglyceryltransferase
MMMAGAERFFIEKIRVNSTYTIWGFHPTQAEIIAVALFIGGLIMFLYTRKQPVASVHTATIENEPAQ